MTIVTMMMALLLVALPAHAAELIRGMVKTVYDGDTLLVAVRSQGRLTVRLYGIDAPETAKPDRPGQAYGEMAKRVLMYKLLGKAVVVEVREQDQYGRAVGIVRQNNRDINAEMVAEGMAWAYRQYLEGPYASEYLRLEETARRHRLGLWRQANPQPPWEYRRTAGGRHRR